jgi:hypothetical protein
MRTRALLALVPLAAVPLLVAATHGSERHAVNVICGQGITTSTTLSADVGPCPSTGVFVNADHVTFNLNGHRITGTGVGNIGVVSTHVGVIVENGSVSGFASADVLLSGASSRIMNLRVSDSGGSGITVSGFSSVVSGNRVFGNDTEGISGTGAGSQYTNNTLQSNGNDGLFVQGAALVSGNKALNNKVGIFVSNFGLSATVTNNIVNGNAGDGIHEAGVSDPTVVTLSGNKAYFNGQLGINALPGATDGGNNKASGNGTLAQCANVVCS